MRVPGEQDAPRLPSPVTGACCAQPRKGRAGRAHGCLCCPPGPPPHCPAHSTRTRPERTAGFPGCVSTYCSVLPILGEAPETLSGAGMPCHLSSRYFSSKSASITFLTASGTQTSHTALPESSSLQHFFPGAFEFDLLWATALRLSYSSNLGKAMVVAQGITLVPWHHDCWSAALFPCNG